MRTENRYTSLELAFPETAKTLFAKAEQDSRERYQKYAELAAKESVKIPVRSVESGGSMNVSIHRYFRIGVLQWMLSEG